MKDRLKYIEHKTMQDDRGEAWIGEVEFSKTGQTIYFNGLALKKMKGTHYAYSEFSNYYDLENRQAYWISGIKKNGKDRHWSGGGKVKIDKNVIDKYLSIVDFEELDINKYEIVEIPKTNKSNIHLIENNRIEGETIE